MIEVALVCEGIDGDDTPCANSLHMPLKSALVNNMALRAAASARGWTVTFTGQFITHDWCPTHSQGTP